MPAKRKGKLNLKLGIFNLNAKKAFKEKSWKPLLSVAGWLGFEPRLTESESVVLPLDDQPADEQRQAIYNKDMIEVKKIFVENWE